MTLKVIETHKGEEGKMIVTMKMRDEETGAEVEISTFGATILSIRVGDKRRVIRDVVLGFEGVGSGGWEKGNVPFLGSTVGRFCNRIGGARFMLDGVEHKLEGNHRGGESTLHGGTRGFHCRTWEIDGSRTGAVCGSHSTVSMVLVSEDGEMGFPGTIECRAEFTLDHLRRQTGGGEGTAGSEECPRLTVSFEARTVDGKSTVVNMTNHVYLNLRGEGNGDVLGHVLKLGASRFTPVGSSESLIPTGEVTKVEGTEVDFWSSPRAIGERIAETHGGIGLDHNFVIDGWKDGGGQKKEMRFAARVEEPETGRVVEVHTTQPGIQVYTGFWLDVENGKGGKRYTRWNGLCLETQHFPDSPNKPQFPTTVLRPGERYHEVTSFTFSTLQGGQPDIPRADSDVVWV